MRSRCMHIGLGVCFFLLENTPVLYYILFCFKKYILPQIKIEVYTTTQTALALIRE